MQIVRSFASWKLSLHRIQQIPEANRSRLGDLIFIQSGHSAEDPSVTESSLLCSEAGSAQTV